MSVDARERALTVFDAFLRYARAGDARPQGEGAGQPVNTDTEITRVAPAPRPPAAPDPSTPQDGGWEDTTRERADVVRAMLRRADVKPTPAARVDERSIIVDDDTLTDPEFERSHLLGAMDLRPSGPMPVEQFVQEMSILIKYGHTAQAAEETERWLAAHPDDLAAQLQIAEFQLARLDRDAAIDRFVSLVGRLVERGDSVGAQDLVQRLRRDVPGDRRVGALAHRVDRT